MSSSENYFEWNTNLTIVVEPDGFYNDSSGLLMPPYYYPDTQLCEYDEATNRLHFWYLNTVYAGQYFYTHNYFEVVAYDGYNLELHYNFWDDPYRLIDVWTISLTRTGGVPNAILDGYVVDADSYFDLARGLVTAGIYSTFTDEEGYFNIELEEGAYNIEISHLGYEEKLYSDIYLPAGEDTYLLVYLQHMYAASWV